MTKLVVGQEIVHVQLDRRTTVVRKAVVTKVGRKWADITVDGAPSYIRWRVDMVSLRAESGGYGTAVCYLDESEYDENVARGKAWDKLRQLVDKQWSPPQGVTSAQIESAIELIQGASA